MLKKIILLPVLAVSLFAAQPILANHHHECQCAKSMSGFNQLHLTSEQETKIKSIKNTMRDSIKANFQKLHDLRVQMHQLVMADKIDETKLNDLVNQKTAILSSIMKTRIVAKNQIYNVLTPKQQAQFQQMVKKWENHKD